LLDRRSRTAAFAEHRKKWLFARHTLQMPLQNSPVFETENWSWAFAIGVATDLLAIPECSIPIPGYATSPFRARTERGYKIN